MSAREIKLMRVGQVDIVIDISWFWIFFLVAFSFYLSAVSLSPELGPRVIISFAGSCLFFASVLTHELAHTFIANRSGLPVDRITLFIFGGVSNLSSEPKSPKTELLMAIAGPISSLLIGGFFLLLYFMFKFNPLAGWLFINLGYLNILLAVFNSIPAYPLDGGRIFRSIIWAGTDDFDKATELASLMGKIFASFIILWGAIQAVLLGVISGLWLVFIGFFLYRMAAAGPSQSRMIRKMEKLKIKDIVRDYPVYNKGENFSPTLDMARNGLFEYIIVKQDNHPAGLLAVDNITFNDRDNIDKKITSLDKLPGVNYEDDLLAVFKTIQKSQAPVYRVMKNEVLIGIITLNDFARSLQGSAEESAS